MKKQIFLLFTLICSLEAFTQLPPLPGIQSPNVSAMRTFGNIPVSYYTGTPDISIPIYTMKSGSIELPITLRYHPGNVKPNEHPGWVGLGWNLDCGGSITRVIHGLVDEIDLLPGTVHSYYPIGYNRLNTSTWYTTTELEYNTEFHDGQYYENEADEFYFNFMGYSGKFIHTNAGWKAVSDKNIKVEVSDDFLEGSDIAFSLRDQMEPYIVDLPPLWDKQTRQFKEFTLTTEDGTKYIFGGDSAIEYIVNYKSDIDQFAANTWYLKKIIDTDNNTILFKYRRNYPICKLSFYWDSIHTEASYVVKMFLHFSGKFLDYYRWVDPGAVDTRRHGGFGIFPVYLTEIKGKNEIISFKATPSKELGYSDNFLMWHDENDTEAIRPTWTYGNYDRFKWEQLDTIDINDKNAEIKHRYIFSYNNPSNERLTLSSFIETASHSSQQIKYAFEYNNIGDLPLYGGDSTDHWGFYNGRTVVGISPAAIYVAKEPDTSIVKTGLLNKITYPTGGYTYFIWEANQYSKRVTLDRETLENVAGVAGGVRIKEIRNYASAETIPVIKKYFYQLNYPNNGTMSSGVINGKPSYNYNMVGRTRLNENKSFSYHITSINNMASYSNNTNGSCIGYSEVVEQSGDGAYTRYLFTNYFNDNQGESHNDHAPSGFIGWDSDNDTYMPSSSLMNERGRLLSTETYTATNIPIENTEFFYDNDPGRFDKFYKRFEVRNIVAFVNYDALVFAAAFKDYYYRYNILSKNFTRYDHNGENPVQITTNYKYNSLDQLVSESITTGDNQTLTNYTLYPGDFAPGTAFIDSLVLKHNLNKPIELVSAKTTGANINIVNGRNISYLDNGKGRIDKEYILEFVNGKPIPLAQFKFSNKSVSGQLPLKLHGNFSTYSRDNKYTEQITFNSYDERGNPLLITPINNASIAYIWGYNNSLISAKVINASNDYIAYSSFEVGSEKGNWSYGDNTVFNIQAKTGKGSYNLNTSQISKSLPSGVYRLQYWAKSAVTITGGIKRDIISSVPDPDGWIFYEKEITITNSPTTITLTGSTYIDELRICPSGAQMTAYTHDPIYGVISESDDNGNIKYYKYDEFGRLKLIKDKNGNILKQYEYHYKDQ